MGRADEFRASNPAERYYDWRSDQNAFCWYDKDNETRIAEEMPFKFLILRQSIRITGVDEQTKQQILSNEVKNVGNEVLKVRLKDGTVLAQGFWNQIKSVVNGFGGHYTKIIYAMDEAGSIICIRVRGKGLLSWGNTIDKFFKKQKEEWIVVNGFEEFQYDGSTYSFPTFGFGGKPEKEQLTNAESLWEELEDYHKQLINAPSTEPIPPAAKQSNVSMPKEPEQIPFAAEEDGDDLPF